MKVFLHTYTPMKVRQTECSETSTYKIQAPWNYPGENIEHTEHSESLKSRIMYLIFVLYCSRALLVQQREREREREIEIAGVSCGQFGTVRLKLTL